MFASILINTNARELNKVFDYVVPKGLESAIDIGARVFVPFGKGKGLSEGYVIELKDTSEFANKEIAKIEDFILSAESIELAKLMAEKYFCNVSDCIKLMLPPGNSSKDLTKRVREKMAKFVYLATNKEKILENINTHVFRSDKHVKLLKFLIDNDGMEISDLEALTEVSRDIMKTLEKKRLYKNYREEIGEKSAY